MSGVGGAFGGSQTVKTALLARIDAALADGRLDFDPARGGATSALSIAVDSADPANFAAAFGFPLPLAALLDPVAQTQPSAVAATAFVRDWVLVVRPGSDLTDVGSALMLHMLAAPELALWRSDISEGLATLHGARNATADDWRNERYRVMEAADTAGNAEERSIAALWEAAVWPTDRGRSTLSAAFGAWRRLRSYAPQWSAAQEERAQAVLGKIRDDQHARHGPEVEPDYPSLFHQRDEALAVGFESNLRWVNEHALQRARDFAQRCIAELGAAR